MIYRARTRSPAGWTSAAPRRSGTASSTGSGSSGVRVTPDPTGSQRRGCPWPCKPTRSARNGTPSSSTARPARRPRDPRAARRRDLARDPQHRPRAAQDRAARQALMRGRPPRAARFDGRARRWRWPTSSGPRRRILDASSACSPPALVRLPRTRFGAGRRRAPSSANPGCYPTGAIALLRPPSMPASSPPPP